MIYYLRGDSYLTIDIPIFNQRNLDMKNLTIRIALFVLIVTLSFIAVTFPENRLAQSWMFIGLMVASSLFAASKRWHVVLATVVGCAVPLALMI